MASASGVEYGTTVVKRLAQLLAHFQCRLVHGSEPRLFAARTHLHLGREAPVQQFVARNPNTYWVAMFVIEPSVTRASGGRPIILRVC